MKKLILFSFILLLQACHMVDPNASVDGVVGTVGGAFGNINQPK
ncbi:hypothetical protein V757_04005 [Pelistega indica]|uniref:Lipoprotein n=1 Tax=Pelistega indica TaxID=1414851 RepID=V8G975_9BURK|nr:hypothetical protein V757_04005 [Pelistega indica]